MKKVDIVRIVISIEIMFNHPDKKKNINSLVSVYEKSPFALEF